MNKTKKKTPLHVKIIEKVLSNLGNDWSEMNSEERKELYKLVKDSIFFGESNSVILCGPPQCGKTTIVKNVVKTLEEENVITKDTVNIVKLDGFLHKDDKLILQHIASQVNYQTSLENISFEENILKILASLSSRYKNYHTTLFILEDIDVFCEHKHQVLLYNLFDICQSSRVPICVLGLTSHVDIMNSMEKRVLSRFSHRIILVNAALTVDKCLDYFRKIMDIDSSNIDKRAVECWRTRTETLLKEKAVKEYFEQQLLINNSISRLKLDLVKLMTSINSIKLLLTVDDFKSFFYQTDVKILLLKNLTVVEMCLVIAIKIYQKNYDNQPFNFEMIYIQFLKFANKFSTSLIKDKNVVLRIFQRLESKNILIPLKNYSNCMNEYKMFFINLTVNQINEGIKLNKSLTTEIKQWINNEVQ